MPYSCFICNRRAHFIKKGSRSSHPEQDPQLASQPRQVVTYSCPI
nr:MAG TPA: retinoblastoma-binding protein-like protein [Caudoviricetes sp.]DAO03309.1 MAG TPA: retinoblastoma-binding protein-like protein [Caudoviricetes sp.]